MPASLSIIIVNYNAAGLIQNCIRSICRHTRDLSFEIIIADNSSSAKDKAVILQNFPEVRWIDMNYNAGFARANNEGIRQAGGEVVLLLNPDIIVENNAISDCFFQFVNSNYVACGVQLLNPDHTPQISGNYAMKGGLNHLLPLPFLGNFLKSVAAIFKVSKPHAEAQQGAVEVDWINGAFLMVKKTAIEKAGLLDEDFFLYAEEAEWCSRLKKTGRLCLFGQYNVIHLQGETANETFQSSGKGYYNLYDRKGLQIMVSNFVRIRKEFGVEWFLVQLFFYIMEVPVLFLGILIGKIIGSKRFNFQQAKGFTKNVSLLVKLSPTIIRNQPHFYKVL
jgi:GT2 family glycosyltransferase